MAELQAELMPYIAVLDTPRLARLAQQFAAGFKEAHIAHRIVAHAARQHALAGELRTEFLVNEGDDPLLRPLAQIKEDVKAGALRSVREDFGRPVHEKEISIRNLGIVANAADAVESRFDSLGVNGGHWQFADQWQEVAVVGINRLEGDEMPSGLLEGMAEYDRGLAGPELHYDARLVQQHVAVQEHVVGEIGSRAAGAVKVYAQPSDVDGSERFVLGDGVSERGAALPSARDLVAQPPFYASKHARRA